MFQNLPLRPKGVHYQIGDTGSVTSRFLSSIFQPITTFFPTFHQDLAPPPPPPLSISTIPSSTAEIAALESAILGGEKSIRWILSEHEKLKRNTPYLGLSSRSVVSLFQRLLALGSYRQFLEFVEREDLLAVEGVGLVKLSLEKFDEARRKSILEELCRMCEREHRIRFRGMLAELELQAQKDLHNAVMRETMMMLSQIMGETTGEATEPVFAKGVAMAKDVEMLCSIIDRIILTRTKIGIETSRIIFERFIELEGLCESIKYALNPAINVPESNNVGRICNEFCERARYKEAYAFIISALQVDKFGFLSDLDILVGIRSIESNGKKTEAELVGLWEALNKSAAISVRDITKHTFAAFIGRACRLKFGNKSQWWEGNGATPLLKMCMEIIILRLRGEVKTEHLSTLVEAWVWNWQGDENARVDTNSLNESIPFMSSFLDVLSPNQLDDVLKQTVSRIMSNCQRNDDEIWPVRVLWPFVASVAQNRRLWANEESIALWALEGAVLRKGLAPKYLAFRTDEEIARFVVRHYLPFRVALESADASEKEKAKAVFYQMRGLERKRAAALDPDIRAGMEAGIDTEIEARDGPFATAILAFKGTGIPCRTLLLDMVYTLYRLGRPADIVNMLQRLSLHTIRPSSSQYARLIRTLAPEYPYCSLALLKLFAKSQYSTFASYIVMVAHKHPHLALSAYRFLTRPNTFPYTPDQPQLAPRRRPKRRLLVAMAWKFANSPALTARQCHRWVLQCYKTTLKLGYSPGPAMGLAIAVAAVQRTIREGVPVRLKSARQKWVVQVVRRQCGPAKARQVQEILMRHETRRREQMKRRSPRW